MKLWVKSHRKCLAGFRTVITVLGRWRQGDFWGLLACPALPSHITEPPMHWKTLFQNKRWRSVKEDTGGWPQFSVNTCVLIPPRHAHAYMNCNHPKHTMTLVSNSHIRHRCCILDSTSELFKIPVSGHSYKPTGAGSVWESQGSGFKSSPVDSDVQ